MTDHACTRVSPTWLAACCFMGVASILAQGCVRAEVAVVSQHTALERQAAGEYPEREQRLDDAAIEPGRHPGVGGQHAAVLRGLSAGAVAIAVVFAARRAVFHLRGRGRADQHRLHRLRHAELDLVRHAELEVRVRQLGHGVQRGHHRSVQPEGDHERHGQGIGEQSAHAYGRWDAVLRGLIHAASGGQGLTYP